jgi:hypothetical protein
MNVAPGPVRFGLSPRTDWTSARLFGLPRRIAVLFAAE